MEKTKILYLFPFGGINPRRSSQVMGQGILNQLIKMGLDIYVIPLNQNELDFAQKLQLKIIPKPRENIINNICYNIFFLKPFKKNLKKLINQIKSLNINVIIERHSFWNLGYIISKKINIPYITNDVIVYPDKAYFQMGIYLSLKRFFHEKYFKRIEKLLSLVFNENYFKRIEKKPFIHSKAIISHSMAYSKVLVKEFGIRSERIFQYYAMVDKNHFYPTNKTDLCYKLGIDPSIFIVTYVGSFDKLHTPDLLIPMIKNLRNLKIIFYLIGDGPLLNKIKNLTDTLNLNKKIIFTGRLDHNKVIDYIQVSDICVESIWNKRVRKFGADSIKIYEYMACGKPVIASDLPGQIQLLKKYNAGILINPSDATIFSHAVKFLYDNRPLCTQMGYNARKIIEDRWNWDYTGNIIKQAIKNCLIK